VWIQYTNVTDGQTPGHSKDRAYAQRRAVKTIHIGLNPEMFYWSFTSLVHFWPPPIFNPGYAYVVKGLILGVSHTLVPMGRRLPFPIFGGSHPFMLTTFDGE